MKLSTTHLFLILLFVLILGCCYCTNTSIFEGSESNTYSGPGGNSATIATGSGGNSAVVANDNSNPNNYNNTATAVTGPAGNTAVTGSGGNTAVVSNSSSSVKRSDIPPGDEDLYVLKTEIIPPVCPKCPKYCDRTEPAPPCPPCARCPEPAFECKKVPNYTSNNDRFLPKPVLNDFSTFGR